MDKRKVFILESAEVRPQLYWWVKKMEARLITKDKSHKKGWLDGDLHYYVVSVFKCWSQVVKAIQYPPSPLLVKQQPKGIKYHDDLTDKDIELAVKKCVDGANFFMMLADNLREIIKERGIKVSGKE